MQYLFTKCLLIITICVMLSGCVTNLQHLQKTDLSGDGFKPQLARLYLNFAESEADQYDWVDSAYFAKKALKLMKGEAAAPENLDKWHLPAGSVPIFIQAREYLTSVLTETTITQYPELTAKAQFMFDCWLEQSEEGWQQADIDHCRDEFYNNLDKVFALTASPQPVIAEKTPEPVTKTVHFSIGSVKFDDKATQTIKDIIILVKDRSNYNITLNSYTDKKGSDKLNMTLSKKRAVAVKEALILGGVDAKLITLFAFGSSEGNKISDRVVEIEVK